MRVAIYGQVHEESHNECIADLLHELKNHGVEAVIEKKYLERIRDPFPSVKDYETFNTHEDLDNSFHLFFSIGGDGTMLSTITYIQGSGNSRYRD